MSAVRGKLQEYADWGVPHIWLVDPRRRLFYHFCQGLHEASYLATPEAGLKIEPGDIFG